jgi:hypothetical protein
MEIWFTATGRISAIQTTTCQGISLATGEDDAQNWRIWTPAKHPGTST